MRKLQKNSAYKNKWPTNFKIMKVIKVKGRLKNCSRPQASNEAEKPNAGSSRVDSFAIKM